MVLSPRDASSQMSLTDLPRSVLAQCLGQLSARDMANCHVALVGDDAASGLLEDASFEALSSFAAEHSLDPKRIARGARETWMLIWAQTTSIFEALEALRDADGTSFPDAGPLTAMLMFGSPYDVHARRAPGTVRVEHAIRIAVDAYVAFIHAASKGCAESPHGFDLIRSRVVGVSQTLARHGVWSQAARIDQNLLRAIIKHRGRGGRSGGRSGDDDEPSAEPSGEPSEELPLTVHELNISASEYLVDMLYSNTYIRVAECDANAVSFAVRCAHRAVAALHRFVAARAPEGWFDDPHRTNDTPPPRETRMLADAMVAYARAMGLAAQHVWLDVMDASRVDAYDARVWPAYPDPAAEDLFDRASTAARSARTIYAHIGEDARAARALAVFAEVSFCEASVIANRLLRRGGGLEDAAPLAVAGNGTAIELFRRALREFDEVENRGSTRAGDADPETSGSAESARRSISTWAATAKKDLGKTLYALTRFARWWDAFETNLPPGALPEGERLATWHVPREARAWIEQAHGTFRRELGARHPHARNARRLNFGFEARGGSEDEDEDEDEQANEHDEGFDIEAQMRIDGVDGGESDDGDDIEPTFARRARRWFRRMRAP